jgi:integral membrane sensor domain MASE1
MAKQQRKNKTPKIVEQERVDRFASILQIVAIVGVVCIVIAQLVTDSATQIPIWIPAGLMGVAVGLSPDQFVELIKAFFTGRKK